LIIIIETKVFLPKLLINKNKRSLFSPNYIKFYIVLALKIIILEIIKNIHLFKSKNFFH